MRKLHNNCTWLSPVLKTHNWQKIWWYCYFLRLLLMKCKLYFGQNFYVSRIIDNKYSPSNLAPFCWCNHLNFSLLCKLLHIYSRHSLAPLYLDQGEHWLKLNLLFYETKNVIFKKSPLFYSTNQFPPMNAPLYKWCSKSL